MADSAVGHEQSHKSHRARQAGASAKKKPKSHKKNKLNANDKDSQKQHNPKAFAFSSSVKAKRLQSIATEKEQRRLHVPTVDRATGEPAPYVVVVHGPPKVGKSLLIKCLVKHYTKHNLTEVRGPITIVSGDFNLAGLTSLPDPCPLPSAAKKKGLRDKEKLSYFAEERVERAER